MLNKVFVRDLALGDEVCTPLAVYEKRLNQFTNKNGQPSAALMLSLGDKTGRLAAVAWASAHQLNESVQIDQVMLVSGRVQEYKGQLQLLVEQIVPVPSSQVNLSDFVPGSRFDREVMWRRLDAVMQSVKNPYLRALLRAIFTPGVRESFCAAPGGREVHHAYVGGLLEHTLEVVSYAEAMLAEQGHFLDRDLLLTGAILHDLGKIEEYSLVSLSFQMTDRGKLLGHLQIASEKIGLAARTIGDFPDYLLAELQHMIISHHGTAEWGSPQEPKSINAMALHLADLVSGRLGQFTRIISEHKDENSQWSSWDRYLERSVFISKGV